MMSSQLARVAHGRFARSSSGASHPGWPATSSGMSQIREELVRLLPLAETETHLDTR